ncbi:MAG TPA: recombinase family protein [Crinalium sp.]
MPDASIWGWEMDRVYQDLGGRQQLDALMNACQRESDTYILVRRLAELGDSVQDISDRLAQLEAFGATLIVIEEPMGDGTLTPRPSDLFRLLQAVQTSQQSRRIRQGHARNRLKALPPPGKAPYGYRRGKDRYTLDRTTAPIVKEFFEHFLLYGSLRGSVRHLQKKYNKKISVSTGQRWLSSPVYRGDLVYQNGEVITDTHVPILSRQESAQVDRLLRRNRRLPPRSASAPRSLAGLVVCATCQSGMTVTRVTTRRKTQEYLYLRPMRCPAQPKCSAIAYQKILDQTIQRICEDLPRAVANIPVPNMDAIKQSIMGQIAAKEAILEQLPALTTSGVLDVETAELRAYKVRTEIAQMQAKLAQLPPVDLKATAQAVSISQFWLDLSEPERRFYFREFIRQIEIVRDGKTWHLQLSFIF